MAFTVSHVVNTVFGNTRVRGLKITCDAATQTVETGLKVIDAFTVGQLSMASGRAVIYANSNVSGTQSMGVLGISAVANGDVLFVMCYGR